MDISFPKDITFFVIAFEKTLLFNNYTGMIQLRQDMYLALLLDGERTRVYDDKNGKLP